MSEYLLPVDVAKNRGKAISEAFIRTFADSKSLGRDLRRDFNVLNQDVFLVYLGLKGASSYLEPIIQNYYWLVVKDNAFENFPQKQQTGVEVVVSPFNEDIIWNPDKVDEILGKNSDLKPSVGAIDPRDPRAFVPQLNSLSNNPQTEEDDVLAGLLHSYPRPAAEAFARNARKIMSMLWDMREKVRTEKLSLDFSIPSAPNELVDKLELKLAVARLGRSFGMDPRVLDYVESMFYPDMPGHTHITIPNTETQAYEAAVKRTYEASGIEKAIDEILAKR